MEKLRKIGSVGGRSSQKAIELNNSGNWDEINCASQKLNEDLLYSLDYRTLANEVIACIES